MNVDQYFRDRAELIARVLLEKPATKLPAPDWRLLVACFVCTVAAMAMEGWAAMHTEAGYFARISFLLNVVIAAMTWLLSIALAASFLLARDALRSRDAVKEKDARPDAED